MLAANEEVTMRSLLEEIIRSIEKENPRVKCIFYKESRGGISCYLEGFRRALQDSAEQIIEMDGG